MAWNELLKVSGRQQASPPMLCSGFTPINPDLGRMFTRTVDDIWYGEDYESAMEIVWEMEKWGQVRVLIGRILFHACNASPSAPEYGKIWCLADVIW